MQIRLLGVVSVEVVNGISRALASRSFGPERAASPAGGSPADDLMGMPYFCSRTTPACDTLPLTRPRRHGVLPAMSTRAAMTRLWWRTS